MKALVQGAGPVGTLLGGLLAAEGHDVAIEPSATGGGRGKRSRLRIVLPGGWRSAAVRRGSFGGEQLVLTARGGEHQRAEAVVLFPLESTLPGGEAVESRRVPAVPVMSAVQLGPGEVELASRRACLVLRQSDCDPVRELAGVLQAAGIEVSFVDRIEGYADSWFLCRLLDLPTALCRTTLEHFLSHSQGREIARHVLEEGLEILSRLGREPAHLPVGDPRDLLERIRRGDRSLESGRFAPGRELNELLQAVLRGEKQARGANEALVRLASQAGSDPRWNWRLAGRRSRLQQGSFFRSPEELLEAIR